MRRDCAKLRNGGDGENATSYVANTDEESSSDVEATLCVTTHSSGNEWVLDLMCII